MRWWTSWSTAEPVVKSVGHDHGADGVGTALLGLHAMGADALRGLSARTCVDTDQVSSTLAALDVGPVAKAWSDAVMPGTDYGWLRAAQVKRDADAAAVRVVSTLVSKGVAWPLALERAAECYGLPSADALSFAGKVSAPVVNPRVLADHADEHLALYASGVCKAESDAAVPISKDDEWVEIHRGGRVYRQQVTRDDSGQFASEGQAVTTDITARRAQKAKDRRKAAQNKRAGMHRANAERAQARTQQASAEFAAMQRAFDVQQAPPPNQQRLVRSDNEVARDRIRSKVAQRLSARRSAKREQYDKRIRAQMAAAPVPKVQLGGSDEWLKAAKENWPVESDPGTWSTTGEFIVGALSQEPTFVATEREGKPTYGGDRVVPVLSVTPDGMKVLLAAAQDDDHDNRYVELVSLEAALRSSGKNLYQLRWLPSTAPLLQMPMSADDDLLINLRLTAAYESGEGEELSDPRSMPAWTNDDDWSKAIEFYGYPFQRIRLDPDNLAAHAASMAWSGDKMKAPAEYEAMSLARNYTLPRLREMAQIVAEIENTDQAIDLSAYDQDTVQELLAQEVIEPSGQYVEDADGYRPVPKYQIALLPPPFHMLLQRMNASVGGHYEALPVGYVPVERAMQLAAHAGVEPDVAARYRQRGPDVMREDTYARGDDYVGRGWDYDGM